METLIENISSTAAGGDISVTGTLIAMACALIYGLVISFTYIKTSEKNVSQSFVVTVSMLPAILTVIIMFVGSNVARAFSLAGTLSIIRFRSAPGDPKDIGYIFFAIAAGLASGVGLYGYGALFVGIMCVFMVLVHIAKFGKPSDVCKNLKITIPEDLDYDGVFNDIMERYTKSYELSRIKTTDLGSLYELTYSVKMPGAVNEKEFIDRLRTRNGNLPIILSMAADSEY